MNIGEPNDVVYLLLMFYCKLDFRLTFYRYGFGGYAFLYHLMLFLLFPQVIFYCGKLCPEVKCIYIQSVSNATVCETCTGRGEEPRRECSTIRPGWYFTVMVASYCSFRLYRQSTRVVLPVGS